MGSQPSILLLGGAGVISPDVSSPENSCAHIITKHLSNWRRPCEHEVSANHSFLRELVLDGPQRAGLPTEGVDGVSDAPCGQDEEPPGPGLA